MMLLVSVIDVDVLILLVMQKIAKYWVGVLMCKFIYPVTSDYTRLCKG
jgi:hypothetical protein